MTRPALISEESKNVPPVLVFDGDGFLGKRISEKLSLFMPVICVSPQKPDVTENVAYIPYKNKIPKIPDYAFSKIIFIENNNSQRGFYSIVKKAEKERIEIVFVESVFTAKEEKIVKILETYDKTKVVICGDMFSEKIDAISNTPVNRILGEAAKGTIKLDGDGTEKIYPVFVDDVVFAIIDASFGKHGSEKRFFAFQEFSPTQLSLARMLKKINPEVRIDFRKQKKDLLKIPFNGKYLIEENYPIIERLKKVNLSAPIRAGKSSHSKKNRADFIWKKFILPILSLFGILIILPIMLSLGFAFLGEEQIKAAVQNLEEGKIETAETNLLVSEKFFEISKVTFSPVAFEAGLLKENKIAESFMEKIEVGRQASVSLKNLLLGYKLFNNVFFNKSKNPHEDFYLSQGNIKQGLLGIEKIKSSNALDQKQKELLNKASPFLGSLSTSLDLFPQIFGISENKKYLVIFQNNMELRPGGGFIGSYAILSLEKGHVKSFVINDVYDADGQLRGHIEPPYPIRRYLSSPHWYLRDSNFDVDFANNASKASYFLNLEKKEAVDGVIAIDTSFVKELISSLGSVYVAQYGETINKDNFVKITQQKAEENFFPGSSQKKDFMSALLKSLQENLTTKKNISYFKIGESILTALREKHILLFFEDPSIQENFTINGWSSSLYDSRKETENTINDFLEINEANLGVNKINPFIKRKVSLNFSLSQDGTAVDNLSIEYENLGNKDYKNYLRLVLPYGTEINDVSINGDSQKIVDAIVDPEVYEKKGFAPPQGLEVDKTQEEGKSIFGFLVLVPLKGKTHIKASYKLPKQVLLLSPTYSLKVFKQPGVDNLPFSFSFSYPSGTLQVIDGKGFIQKEGELNLSEDILEDKEFNISFGSK